MAGRRWTGWTAERRVRGDSAAVRSSESGTTDAPSTDVPAHGRPRLLSLFSSLPLLGDLGGLARGHSPSPARLGTAAATDGGRRGTAPGGCRADARRSQGERLRRSRGHRRDACATLGERLRRSRHYSRPAGAERRTEQSERSRCDVPSPSPPSAYPCVLCGRIPSVTAGRSSNSTLAALIPAVGWRSGAGGGGGGDTSVGGRRAVVSSEPWRRARTVLSQTFSLPCVTFYFPGRCPGLTNDALSGRQNRGPQGGAATSSGHPHLCVLCGRIPSGGGCRRWTEWTSERRGRRGSGASSEPWRCEAHGLVADLQPAMRISAPIQARPAAGAWSQTRAPWTAVLR